MAAKKKSKKRAAPKKAAKAAGKTNAAKRATREKTTGKKVIRRVALPKLEGLHRDKTRPLKDKVDETSLESFPASDPPAWTPVTGEDR